MIQEVGILRAVLLMSVDEAFDQTKKKDEWKNMEHTEPAKCICKINLMRAQTNTRQVP